MLLLAVASLAHGETPPSTQDIPVIQPLPEWETGTAGFGERFGRAGAWGVGAGLAVAGTGLLLMATTSCEDCFEPPAQWWIGLGGIGIGAVAVGLSTPAAVAGPVIRSRGLQKAGFNVTRGAGWAAVGMASAAGVAGIAGALVPDESPALGVTSGILVGGALIAAGVQTGQNNQAKRPTASLELHLAVAPNGLGVSGTF